MTSDPYRPPDARLEDARTEPRPRSLSVAVALGLVARIAIFVVGRFAVPQVWDTQLVFIVAGGGLLSGWVASRYRRETWLDACLCLIALEAIPNLVVLAYSIAGRTSPPSLALLMQFFAGSALTLAGGRLGWKPS